MLLELNDICFFVKSLKLNSSNNFLNISKYASATIKPNQGATKS